MRISLCTAGKPSCNNTQVSHCKLLHAMHTARPLCTHMANSSNALVP
jgi:hypothetical protein